VRGVCPLGLAGVIGMEVWTPTPSTLTPLFATAVFTFPRSFWIGLMMYFENHEFPR
jgi:hypothetical protein